MYLMQPDNVTSTSPLPTVRNLFQEKSVIENCHKENEYIITTNKNFFKIQLNFRKLLQKIVIENCYREMLQINANVNLIAQIKDK